MKALARLRRIRNRFAPFVYYLRRGHFSIAFWFLPRMCEIVLQPHTHFDGLCPLIPAERDTLVRRYRMEIAYHREE